MTSIIPRDMTAIPGLWRTSLLGTLALIAILAYPSAHAGEVCQSPIPGQSCSTRGENPDGDSSSGGGSWSLDSVLDKFSHILKGSDATAQEQEEKLEPLPEPPPVVEAPAPAVASPAQEVTDGGCERLAGNWKGIASGWGTATIEASGKQLTYKNDKGKTIRDVCRKTGDMEWTLENRYVFQLSHTSDGAKQLVVHGFIDGYTRTVTYLDTAYTPPPREINFSDGGKYYGQVSASGKMDGQGTLTFPNGDKWIGRFSEGKKHGQGTYYWTNGNKFIGESLNDQFYNGKEYNSNGAVVAEYASGQKKLPAPEPKITQQAASEGVGLGTVLDILGVAAQGFAQYKANQNSQKAAQQEALNRQRQLEMQRQQQQEALTRQQEAEQMAFAQRQRMEQQRIEQAQQQARYEDQQRLQQQQVAQRQQQEAYEQQRLQQQEAQRQQQQRLLAQQAAQRAAERPSFNHSYRLDMDMGRQVYLVTINNTGNVKLACTTTIWGIEYGNFGNNQTSRDFTDSQNSIVWPGTSAAGGKWSLGGVSRYTVNCNKAI